MRPVIGITADVREGVFVVPCAYADSVTKAGGYPLLLAPSGFEQSAYPEKEQAEKGICRDHATALAEMIDGLLIPGGGDIPPRYYGEDVAVNEALLRLLSEGRICFELMLLKLVIGSGKPVLAICYGMQLLNVYLGGALYQDLQAQRPDCSDHLRGEHLIACDPFLECPDEHSLCSVGTSHHQAVKTLGRGLEVVACANDGIIEGIRLRGRPFVVGVQWHPERSEDHLSSNVFSQFIRHASMIAEERIERL